MSSNNCEHRQYMKKVVEQSWQGHATLWVLVERKCAQCGHTQQDWEFGDHESIGGSRMFPDDINFFTGGEFEEVIAKD